MYALLHLLLYIKDSLKADFHHKELTAKPQNEWRLVYFRLSLKYQRIPP